MPEFRTVLTNKLNPSMKECCEKCKIKNAGINCCVGECSCHTPTQNKVEEWEVTFDKKFGFDCDYVDSKLGKEIKRFVSSTLNAREEELVGKIRQIKREMKYNAMVKMGDLSFGNYTPTEIYCKALSDILALIKEK